MFPFILMAFLIAKIKKYSIMPIFKTYTLYPLFLVELIYIYFQINIFIGNYSFIQYSSILQTAYIAVLFLPIITYKLYPQALFGSAMMITGTLMNKLVIYMNDGKMPVFPTLSKLTGYFKPDSLSQSGDGLHILMTGDSKLNFLADYVDIGWSIMSVGDVLIHSFIGLIVYYTLKTLNNSSIVASEKMLLT